MSTDPSQPGEAGQEREPFSSVKVRGYLPDGTWVCAWAFDKDPASATYVYGPFGFGPMAFAADLPGWVESQEDAQRAADELLEQVRGGVR